MKKPDASTNGNGAGADASRIAALSAPDSPLIAKTIDYARRYYAPSLFNHIIRSWLFAAIFARAETRQVDDEVIAISVLLHDLGLTQQFAGPNRFEVDGANAAQSFARSNSVNRRRSQLIWDSVALHSTPSISQHKEREVALCSAGVTLDHFGTGMQKVTPEEMSVILDAFPRLDLKRTLRSRFSDQALAKPGSTYESFVSDFGQRYVSGYKVPSSVDALLNAPFNESP